ncbi:C40 family peptidase [Streptomyces sp. JJ36]|nr:C40 family peptidase [Streptomyces sp. JJ36]
MPSVAGRPDAEAPGDAGADTAAGPGGDAAAPSGDGEPDGEPGAAGPAAGEEPGLEEIRKRIKTLHDRAGSATDAYNAAEERAKKQRRKIDALARKIDANEARLKKLRQQAGAMARAQYRSGALPEAARLMLSDDPDAFLRDAGLVRKGQQAARGVLTRLTSTRERLTSYAADAEQRGKALEKDLRQKAAAKKRVEAQLEKAEKLESKLEAEERARLRELERQAAYARQLRWLRTGILEEIDGKASAPGRKALAYATAQIGKDYEWGAEGPETFDCSGLTLRAWEAAGVTIPRTSQEQWRRLPRVPVEEMRPGDLIIYKEDASHVGMYVGDGAMVHAPRTGRQITVEGAGSLPILGVVRPDA